MRLLTTDLFEGAYLLSQGMELNDIWTDEGVSRRGLVVFEFNGDNIELLKDNYRKGRASANVTAFKRSLNELKDRMFGMLREKRIERQNQGGRDEIYRDRIAGVKR